MSPGGKFAAGLENFRATTQERTHREHEYLIEELVGLTFSGRRSASRCIGARLGACAVPRGDMFDQTFVTSDVLDTLAIRPLYSTESAHDVRRLADDEPKVGQGEGNVFEAQERACLRLMARKDLDAQFERGQGDPSLYPSLHLEKFEVHVNRIGKLGLPFAERTQFNSLPGVGPTEARRGFSHSFDHTGTGGTALNHAIVLVLESRCVS